MSMEIANNNNILGRMPVSDMAKKSGLKQHQIRYARMIAQKMDIGEKKYGMRFLNDEEWGKVIEYMTRERPINGVRKIADEYNVSPSYIYGRLKILGLASKQEYTDDEKILIMGRVQ
jgi:hypothetical protein